MCFFYCRLFGQREGQPPIIVKVYGLTETARMRDLNPENIDQLISIKVRPPPVDVRPPRLVR